MFQILKRFIILLISAAFAGTCINSSAFADTPFIILQSTTSTQNSGLYDYILPQFTKQSGIEVRVVAVGTGQALRNAQNCDGDLLLVHSKPDEEHFVNSGFGAQRRNVMYNDFIIIGPKKDPEKLKYKKTIKDVFETIKIKKLSFLTRGDNSGTHKREVLLWKKSGINHLDLDRNYYIDAGRGMGATLNMAASMDAYTITDRGTWLSFNNKQDLDILFSGVPPLHNQYSVIVINPKIHHHVKYKLASDFSNWLVSNEGQKLISEFKISGKQLFFPNYKE